MIVYCIESGIDFSEEDIILQNVKNFRCYEKEVTPEMNILCKRTGKECHLYNIFERISDRYFYKKDR